MESEEESIQEAEDLETQDDKPSDEVAKEECLFSLATLALELEAGRRNEISAFDIFAIFKAHDVEEILDEARLYSSSEDDEEADEEDNEA